MAKNPDLTRSLLIHAVTCLHHGDASQLRDMGFSERAAQAVGELTLRQLVALEGKIHPKVLRTSLDEEAFWRLIDQIKREAERDRIKTELLRHDAPVQMMQELFGVGAKRYAAMRKALGVPASVGRPGAVGEEEIRAVWSTWERVVGKGRPSPEHFIQIADATGASIRAIWRLRQGWKNQSQAADPSLPGQDLQQGPDSGNQRAACRRVEP
jgi:hypothetical protein